MMEIFNWISSGPILQPPTVLESLNRTDAPITTPSYAPATLQYVSTHTLQPDRVPTPAQTIPKEQRVFKDQVMKQRVVPGRGTTGASAGKQRVDSPKKQRVNSIESTLRTERATGIDRSHLARGQNEDTMSRKEAVMFLDACFAAFKKSSLHVPNGKRTSPSRLEESFPDKNRHLWKNPF